MALTPIQHVTQDCASTVDCDIVEFGYLIEKYEHVEELTNKGLEVKRKPVFYEKSGDSKWVANVPEHHLLSFSSRRRA